ncbi:MAG: Mu-like prophage major head subunit gpT family protein [Bilophila sp.]
MALVTNSLVSALRVGFQREFQEALSSAPSHWDSLSTRVPSSSASNTYGWIGQFPKLQEWSGDRSFKNIKEHGYSVVNKLYEATVDIPRTAVEDDDIGVYAPLFREMGYAAGTHPDEIIFGLLKNGSTGTCYDGKGFFAVDHPVYANVDGTDASGATTGVSVANWLRPAAVSGTVTDKTAWYLLDVSRPLRPFIFQERTAPELQVITNPENDYVFMKDKIPYGIRYRCNGGYGFWQQAVKSTNDLTVANFESALTTMQNFTADGGRPLGLGFGGETGTLLVVPPSLQAAARKILLAELAADGSSNIWYKSATLLVSHWLI